MMKVKRVAEMLNIAHLLGRKPAELSGGQRQRVAMGRALVRDAGTFLFDEPLSNLDAKLRAKMRTELAEMRNILDKNMIYVTHDQVEAMTLGDRIVVMHNGVVQQQGSPEDLFKNPVNRFVAGFIGSPSMNFLDGEIMDEAGQLRVQGDGFALPIDESLGARINAAGLPSGSPKVEVGIRPSSILVREEPSTAPLNLKVTVAEYLGAQSVLATRCGDTEVLVETSSDGLVLSNEITPFHVKTADMMLFSEETGIRI